jgi:hypothetical protein
MWKIKLEQNQVMIKLYRENNYDNYVFYNLNRLKAQLLKPRHPSWIALKIFARLLTTNKKFETGTTVKTANNLTKSSYKTKRQYERHYLQ